MRRYDAVIFDLFGTLVFNGSREDYDQSRIAMAAALGVQHDDLRRLWNETFEKRNSGGFETIEANFAYVLEALGMSPDPRTIGAASELRRALTRRALTPRPEAHESLVRLKAGGLKIGLISNCTPEVPELLRELPFASLIDVPVFSCWAGCIKPALHIYRLACDRLGVAPGACIYVGDGESQELIGATEAGMRAVRIPAPYDEGDDPGWSGPTIHALTEVIGLLAEMPPV